MVTDRACPTCSGWLCRGDDAFCGACGQPCAQLTLEALPSVLPLGQVPPKIGLRIGNPTCAPVRVIHVTGPEWLEVPPIGDLAIEPGSSKTVLARAKTFSMRQPDSAAVRVQTSLGEAAAMMMVIQETPTLTTLPLSLEYWPNGPAGVRDYDVDLFPESGHLRIHGLLDKGEGWAQIRTAETGPLVAGRERPFRLSLRLNPDRLPPLRAGAATTLNTRARLDNDGPHGVAQVTVNLSLDIRKPPELSWIGVQSPPRVRWQTPGQIIGFTLRNALDTDTFGGRENARLAISDVILRPPAGSAATVQRLSPLPVTMAGGEAKWIEFQTNTESLDPRIHYFTLQVTTNRRELDRTFRVPIQIRAVEPFDGLVAIDFGTSNTCCALLPDGGDYRLVTLDEQRTTAPTIVRYLDLSGIEPVIETGLRVKHLAAVDEGVAGGTVSRLKQQLGEATFPLTLRPMNSEEWQSREAREAAADYLRHLRTVVERQQGASFREFILTHPAVCSLRQYRNLRFAVQRAFGSGARVHFLQEPLASLVPFFAKQGEEGVLPTYTVAAFDLGGGTSDITVVRVMHTLNTSGVLEIRPEVVASWGERFGGENLTDYLVDEIKGRCRRLLASERPGYQIAERAVRGASTPSIRKNESALREWSEAFKASLSDEGTPAKMPDRIHLSIVPDALDQIPYDHPFVVDDLQAVGEALETIFLAYLRSQVGRLAERLMQSVAGERLDFIQLSGKTAFLAAVGQLMRERFKDTHIERARNPRNAWCAAHASGVR